MIAIKEAQPNELNIIQDIARRTWPVTYGDILRAEQIAYMLDRFYSTESLNANLDDGHHFLLARENDVVLGFASFVHDAPEKSNTKIPKIYVLPQTQGKGIGQKLMETIEHQARQHGATKLTLNVNRFNKALTFYQHLGFKIVAEIDINIGHGYLMEDYIMEKPLA